MKSLTTLFFLLFSTIFGLAQEADENLRYEDFVYLDNIKTVKFTNGRLIVGYPIVGLETNERLVLSFDNLEDEVKNYVYTFVHCDYDWKPSNIPEMDYLDGFGEDDIDTYDFSFNTTTNYTNYRLVIPNGDIRWTKSGNYLLKVYDDTDDRQLAITRRFVVMNPKISIRPNMRYPANVSKARTHQEIDFVINYEKFPIRNPQSDIKVVVMQNGRWDSAIKNIKPLFVKQDELIYDYQDKLVFPAGKEFRAADLRTFEYNTVNVKDILETRDRFDITLFPDESRAPKAYIFIDDLNGKFLVESFEERDAEIRAEYGYVLFSILESPAFQNHDVYLFGEFTDWRIDDRYRMTYNNLVNAYVGQLLMKQGFYNYAYAVVDRDTKSIDLEELEGNWHETENEYTILVYYSPFGARYDQVIGAVTFSSTR